MTTIFALSGGGNLGAVQVGMLRALAEDGIAPDVIVGTSVGAINGAWLAGRERVGDVAGLAEIWTTLQRADVFPLRLPHSVAGIAGRRDHLVSNQNLRGLLEEHIPFDLLEQARTPLHVVAVDVLRSRSVLLSHGPTIDAILASAAIPGVYPPVRIDGRMLVDGGLVDGTPISHAVSLGASTVWALPAGFGGGLDTAPRGAIGMMLHAIGVLGAQQLARDTELYGSRVSLRVVPAPAPIDVPPHDFSQADRLIDLAYERARGWLDADASGRRNAAGGSINDRLEPVG